MQNEEELGPVNNGRGGGVHDWGRLPLYAIERILSFLNFHDRSQASIVCKSWGEAYECPDFWRSTVFILSKGYRTRPCFNPESVVARFGRHFRKLTVYCRNESRKNERHMFEIVTNFFHSMEIEGVQLVSLRMPRLMVVVMFMGASQAKVCEKVINFLRSQTCLATVNLNYGQVHQLAGLEILENLVAENVRHLMLQNFFEKSQEINRLPRFVRAICRFPQLRSLSLNYAYLTSDVLKYLAFSVAGRLKLLKILIDESEFHDLVTVDSWTLFLKKCPQLQLHIRIELVKLREVEMKISHILCAGLPLKSLQHVIRRTWERDVDNFIFGYLRDNFRQTLRDVEFDFWQLNEETFQSDLVVMVASCSLLENLTVRMRYPYFSINQFFDRVFDAVSQLMNANGIVNLKMFRVTFRGLSGSRKRMKKDIQAKYIPLFRQLGVRLIMRMKK